MNDFINEKFSSKARSALVTAQRLSKELKHPFIGTAHLIYGIVFDPASFAAEALYKNGANKESVRLELVRMYEGKPAKKWRPQISAKLRDLIEKAVGIAAKYNYKYVGTEHFLFALLSDKENTGKKVLQALRIDTDSITKHLLAVFETAPRFPEGMPMREHQREVDNSATPSVLEYFTTDLTEKARSGAVDPLIGRHEEVDRLISILSRRTKNNPVLIGDPGVGKTAIVEGLALAINDGNVPEHLRDKRILNLDLALMVAGTMFRGEFENRLKQLIDEVREDGRVIIFIDELHTLSGAGATTGTLDAANILKPSLAKGDIRVIGATTLEEYKKYIEDDSALERRFQPILVNEPSEQETIDILQGLKTVYENHHKVKITDEAIMSAVKLSVRFIPERFLPDKAIDLIDETAAFYHIHANPNQEGDALARVTGDLEKVKKEKERAILELNFAYATDLLKKEGELTRDGKHLRTRARAKKRDPFLITSEHVAETAARMTGIPVKKVLKKEAKKYLSLEKTLQKKVVGQEEAIASIAAVVRRSRAGIGNINRPLGSIIMLGPSGVGKTYLAKVLAQEIFEEGSFIRIDMSEFMERHNIARLIGAPAGYVGYGEGGRLTEAIRRKPHSVILFDEIEKAHPDVFNLLLQVLEEGELTDASGKRVNFRNSIILMTSNIGLEFFDRLTSEFGFDETKDSSKAKAKNAQMKVMERVAEFFRPEFINRVDKIVFFNPLTRDNVREIVRLELTKFSDQMGEQKIKIHFSPSVINVLTDMSFNPAVGARAVRKNLQEQVEDAVARLVLEGKITPGKSAEIEASKKTREIKVQVK